MAESNKVSDDCWFVRYDVMNEEAKVLLQLFNSRIYHIL